MSLSFALNSFRSSTALLSSRSLTHAPRSLRSAHLTGRRWYSDEKPASEPPKDESPEQEKQEEKPVSPEVFKAKEAEVVDLKGRLRYLQADFLNLQRNSAREKEQQRDYAITRFASDLLETVDVLGLALKSVPPDAVSTSDGSPSPPSSDSASSLPKSYQQYLQDLHTGVDMTHRLLLQTLFKYKVTPFDPTGEKFDPNRHEAIYQAPVPGKEPGTVLETQKTGYMIKDRVLRAAQVGVVQDTS